WHYIAPGKPHQNVFIESSNGRLPNGHRQFDVFFGSTISKFGLNVSKSENNSSTFSACPTTLIWPDWTAPGNVTRGNMISSRASRVNVSEASAAASCLFAT